MQLFFALTLFISATLLFVVQPMFAKMVLPLLGGSPAVWNTCMVFYQGSLLAGYLYAHFSTKWLGVRRQAGLHMAVLCLPWLVLPLGMAACSRWRCTRRGCAGCRFAAPLPAMPGASSL